MLTHVYMHIPNITYTFVCQAQRGNSGWAMQRDTVSFQISCITAREFLWGHWSGPESGHQTIAHGRGNWGSIYFLVVRHQNEWASMAEIKKVHAVLCARCVLSIILTQHLQTIASGFRWFQEINGNHDPISNSTQTSMNAPTQMYAARFASIWLGATSVNVKRAIRLTLPLKPVKPLVGNAIRPSM